MVYKIKLLVARCCQAVSNLIVILKMGIALIYCHLWNRYYSCKLVLFNIQERLQLLNRIFSLQHSRLWSEKLASDKHS
jgi:hypothetical protein